MAPKRYKTEEIIRKLREADVTYYRWRKELEKENARLKRPLADAERDKSILREALRRETSKP